MKGTAKVSQFWLDGGQLTQHAAWAAKDSALGMEALSAMDLEHWLQLSDTRQRELVRRAHEADLNQ